MFFVWVVFFGLLFLCEWFCCIDFVLLLVFVLGFGIFLMVVVMLSVMVL